MRNEFDYIIVRIKDWAEAHRKPVAGLSYSSDTIESRLMVHGPIVSGNSLRIIPGWQPNKRIKATDQAIYALDNRRRHIINNKYMEERTEDECFELANLGRTKYYSELNGIYLFISGWLREDLR